MLLPQEQLLWKRKLVQFTVVEAAGKVFLGVEFGLPLLNAKKILKIFEYKIYNVPRQKKTFPTVLVSSGKSREECGTSKSENFIIPGKRVL